MKDNGYRVLLFFLWLPNDEMAVARVANRVQQGGHDVPPNDIRRRYAAGVRNLFQLYRPILDGWWLYDASRLPPRLIAADESQTMTVRQKSYFARSKRKQRNHVKKTSDQSLTKLANAAFERAAQKVLERARLAGTPVIVWEGDALKKLKPHRARKEKK